MFFLISKNSKKNLFSLPENISDSDVRIIHANDVSQEKRHSLLDRKDTIFIGPLEDFLKLQKNIKARTIIKEDFARLSDKKKKLLEDLCVHEQIEGVMDESRPFALYLPLLSKLIESRRTKNNLAMYEKNLDKMLKEGHRWLEKIKKIHHYMLPLREENFKGIKIKSKYVAGTKSGGEFLDILRKDNQILLFLTFCSSYKDSSIIFSSFEKLRNSENFSFQSIRKFVISFIEQIDANNQKSEKNIQLFLMGIDCLNLKAYGYSFGETKIISHTQKLLPGNELILNKNVLDKAKFEFAFTKEERSIIISPGLKKNYQSFLGEKAIYQIIREKKENSVTDMAFEVFYMLKKNRDDDFLEYDGSLLTVEIEKNVII